MERADLSFARMEGAVLGGARMEGADLSFARMEGADLGGARMEGAVLWATNLRSADLSDANFAASALRSVDLTISQYAPPDQVMKSFGDGSVTLTCAADAPPPCRNFARPAHWPTQHLSVTGFFLRWKGWRLSQGLPAVPSGKALDWLRNEEEYPALRPEEEAFYAPAPEEVCGEGGTASGWACR